MAIYRSENGKAPAGLSVGDEVVTGGGTYRITGVNADGTYQSQVSNKQQTSANYKGQYTQRSSPALSQGVSGYTRNKLNGLEGGYTPGAAVQQAQAYLNQVQANRPGAYQSQWDGELTELYNNIRNRKKFSYDLGTDPVYQQYREQYQRQGRLAMQDTMGNAAALTGGYGSSYASTAGNQAYQSSLNDLNNVIPSLYDRAYGKYRDDKSDKLQHMQVLQNLDDADYKKYQDTLSDYYNTLNYLQSQSQYLSESDYNRYLNQLAQWQYELEYYTERPIP